MITWFAGIADCLDLRLSLVTCQTKHQVGPPTLELRQILQSAFLNRSSVGIRLWKSLDAVPQSPDEGTDLVGANREKEHHRELRQEEIQTRQYPIVFEGDPDVVTRVEVKRAVRRACFR